MPLDIVAHLEYFYQTLACDVQTHNPFTAPGVYAALMAKDVSG